MARNEKMEEDKGTKGIEKRRSERLFLVKS
jgi:hypothetical protein